MHAAWHKSKGAMEEQQQKKMKTARADAPNGTCKLRSTNAKLPKEEQQKQQQKKKMKAARVDAPKGTRK